MTVWFSKPKEIFKSDKILEFWPTTNQSPGDRINATTRFVIYLSSVIYLMKRDVRIFLLAFMIIGALYVLYKSGNVMMIPFHGSCQEPTYDNPMANVLLTDYVDRPNRPSACDYPLVASEISSLLNDTMPYDAGRSRSPLPSIQQRMAARQFNSTAVTQIPGNQTSFAEFCYGKKFQPMCRDTPSVCDPNFRGVQLEAFAGLDSSGDKRSGMRFGGAPSPA
jgi:hypothetical protein